MKYVSQLLFPDKSYKTKTSFEGELWERGQRSSVKSSGCGICAAVMVADRLLPNSDFDLDAAISISYSVEANHKRGTDYNRFAPAFAEKLGLIWESTNNAQRLRECLQTGGAAVLNVSGDREGYVGVFSHGGHYIAAISQEPDGRIAILDPSYKEGKYEEEGRKGLVEMKNGVIALCDMQVLIDDTANRDPGFYLFWRK